jgi:hypothetical protein
MGMDLIKAYLKDPDVKFILTERDPDKWVNLGQQHGSARGQYGTPVSVFDPQIF